MIGIPSAGEIQEARDGLLSVESLLVRLVARTRQLEAENADLRGQLAAVVPVAPVAPTGPEMSTRRCQDCPAFLPKQSAGRPFKRCPTCRDRARKAYLAGRWGKETTGEAAATGSIQDSRIAGAPPEAPVTEAVNDPIVPQGLDSLSMPPAVERYQREQAQALDPPVLPERRCGRCCHKYPPTVKDDYYCAGCRAAGAGQRAAAAPRDPELVSNGWNGRGPLTNKVNPNERGLGSGLSPGLLARSGH